MKSGIEQAVRDVCLWLPESIEAISHGSSSFKVRSKTFAYFVVNHHGDGRVALWLNAAPGLQQSYVLADPRRFFVPPYLGPRGWVGVELDQGLSWQRIATLVREAYEHIAPAVLARSVGETPAVAVSVGRVSAAERDPLQSAPGKALLKTLRKICLQWPETQETVQFGYPVWQAGRKTFASARFADGMFTASFWVGVDQQQLRLADSRFRIPPYVGHNGWMALDVSAGCDPQEVGELAWQSYRHFALKRMLQLVT